MPPIVWFDLSTDVWTSVVEQADEGDDRELLLQLLLCAAGAEEITPNGRLVLADFLTRNRFLRKQAGKPSAQDRALAARVTAIITAMPGDGALPEEWATDLTEFLLNRRRAKKHGGQATPIYRRSEMDAALLCAEAETRALQVAYKQAGRELPLEKVAEEVAPLHELGVSELVNYIQRRRGSHRHRR